MPVDKRLLPHRTVDQNVAVHLDRQPDPTGGTLAVPGLGDTCLSKPILAPGYRPPAPANAHKHSSDQSERCDKS
jgi:hypothetical protein